MSNAADMMDRRPDGGAISFQALVDLVRAGRLPSGAMAARDSEGSRPASRRRRPRRGGDRPLAALRWVPPLVTAGLLSLLQLVRAQLYPLELLPKGSVAPHVIRATCDAVFDLHETAVAEAEEAKQSWIPIYEKYNALLYEHQAKILAAVLGQPVAHWSWPPLPGRGSDGGGDAAKAPADLGPPDLRPRQAQLEGRETGVTEAGAPAEADGGPSPEEKLRRARRQELESLVHGFFSILEPFYKDGVVEDGEFPWEKKTIRIYSRKIYHLRPVADLHRFSDLRPLMEQRGGQFFFKTDRRVRDQVITFILQRLPPNLSYSKENEKFIKDISQVTGRKMVLIRRGQVLARPGQVVDTRAYYAIKASFLSASVVSGAWSGVGRMILMVALMLLFVLTTQEVCAAAFRGPRAYLVVFCGMVLLAVSGDALLLLLPMPASAVPQASLALALGVVLGRGAGLLTGIAVPFTLLLAQHFDLPTLLVGVGGGVTAALAVRKRRRGSVLAAGILVGVVQALVFEICRAAEGRPQTWDERWSAAETFIGGLAAGALALVALPFVERILGQSSRGKLKVLTDFDHPLARQLREQAPGTFAHTVTLINMVELAVEAVGGDRLLARAGTLFHDVGKMQSPSIFLENQGVGPDVHDRLAPSESARAIVAHVADGLAIARQYSLPADVTAFISEHHGTTGLDRLIHKAKEAGEDPDPRVFHFPGPRPRSLETAILMIADSVEVASRTLAEPSEQALHDLVDRVVLKKFTEYQFEECGITQGQLEAVKAALVGYLVGALHRRIKHPGAAEDEGGGDRGAPA